MEEQLIDGRQWLFDTQEPTLADISVHYALNIGSKSSGESVHLEQDRLPNLAKVGVYSSLPSLYPKLTNNASASGFRRSITT